MGICVRAFDKGLQSHAHVYMSVSIDACKMERNRATTTETQRTKHDPMFVSSITIITMLIGE
jgi:hypothetical protein